MEQPVDPHQQLLYIMDILILYQYFGTPKGSWSTRIYELCKRWVDLGHKITVVTAPYEKSDIKAKRLVELQEIAGINLVVINTPDSNKDKKLFRIFNAIRFAMISTFYMFRIKYDVVLASSGPITIGIPAVIANKILGKKMIFEVRDLWPAGAIEMNIIKNKWLIKMALAFEKICYKRASLVVTASIGQREHIENRFEALNMLVIPNASDNDLFQPKADISHLPDWTHGAKIFTHVGSIGFIHNCQLIIDAARELKKKGRTDIYIVFIGDGADRTELQRQVTEDDLAQVVFLGLKPKYELPAWIQSSMATLFTTLNNEVQDASSPNKIFDSFAAGVPIIQTSRGWIKAMVAEHQCGLNVPPDEPLAFADAIIKFADDVSLAEVYGSNAQKLALTEFNRDLLAKKYLDAIEELVHTKHNFGEIGVRNQTNRSRL